MARLFRLDASGNLTKAEEKPFEDELNEMEPFVMRNAGVIWDVVIFGEQTVSSGRDKRTDLLGVDKNRDVLIIELKKDHVGKEVLSQILEYSHYWKTHPDSARSIWNEHKEKHADLDIQPDWNNYDPRMLVVGSSVDPELVQIAASHELDIRFFEITRYQHEGSFFIMIDELEQPTQRERPVSGRQNYDWGWFAEEVAHGDTEVKIAKWLHEELLTLSQSKGWSVATKFNKYSIAFQRGGRNPFWLEVRHKGKVALCVQWRDESVDPSRSSNAKWQWDKSFGFWYTEVDSTQFDLQGVVPVLEAAYQNVVKS